MLDWVGMGGSHGTETFLSSKSHSTETYTKRKFFEIIHNEKNEKFLLFMIDFETP